MRFACSISPSNFGRVDIRLHRRPRSKERVCPLRLFEKFKGIGFFSLRDLWHQRQWGVSLTYVYSGAQKWFDWAESWSQPCTHHLVNLCTLFHSAWLLILPKLTDLYGQLPSLWKLFEHSLVKFFPSPCLTVISCTYPCLAWVLPCYFFIPFSGQIGIIFI